MQNESGDEEDEEDEEDEAAEVEERREKLAVTSDQEGIRTGEEEEDVLFSRRSKMFRFNDEKKEWKERGLGELKLLLNRRTGRIRVLMRREETLKVCANHVVTKDLELQPMAGTDKAWTYFTADYSGINEMGEYTGEVYTELFAFRFKDPQAARDWKDAWLESGRKREKMAEEEMAQQQGSREEEEEEEEEEEASTSRCSEASPPARWAAARPRKETSRWETSLLSWEVLSSPSPPSRHPAAAEAGLT
ncbi:hypothetical protein GUITHDRAFT_78472 [Guillardia theta CCMP2712]|uniref:RanBD1 domain-containing protein n=1 Tax=Guillardia theta (strain CCMP2712) TaxID=905079 RepID=L1IL99_GUITC|nr:hypothetical protein GUITHDRAFT_78472 [Guillardia theta CCMP2712]EKX37021.1 hypothetical protein GUITHDRAFT_78472 [Guillardia theta CCMP2712]|eukprot:XP_005824001.1 hypothetical protein GUITHDRAFT_78472 [Guillardia theta CCMP2712]